MVENEQPTEEQLKKFWEWCGLERPPKSCKERNHMVVRKGGYPFCQPVELDLNNLFKYAVPKLGEWSIEFRLNLAELVECIITKKVHHNDATDMLSCHPTWRIVGEGKDKDPALALFWAIYKVTEAEDGK